jgi:transcription initiation factor IIF auxiliary subunit
MSLRIRNKWQYKGNDRWDWEAFLEDEGTGELDRVESVEYVLHPTFPNPIRRVNTPQNQFALRTNGWGTFQLKAFVNLKGGKRVKLTHELEMSHEPASGVTK